MRQTMASRLFGLTAPNYHELTVMLAGRIMLSVETGRDAVSAVDLREVFSQKIIPLGRDENGNVDYQAIKELILRNGKSVVDFLTWLSSLMEYALVGSTGQNRVHVLSMRLA